MHCVLGFAELNVEQSVSDFGERDDNADYAKAEICTVCAMFRLK